MPFDVDCRDADYRRRATEKQNDSALLTTVGETAQALALLPEVTTNAVPVACDAIERGAMAAFCASLSPDDWIALEGLGQRVRNAMLKQTVRIALRWRKRRRPECRTVLKK